MEVDDYETLDYSQAVPYWQNGSSESYEGVLNGSDPEIIPIATNVTTTIPFIPLGLGIIIVTGFGLVGNILSAIVLSRKRLQSSYSVLTLGLTFVDSVYLVTKLLRYGIASLFVYCDVAKVYTNIGLPIVGPYLRAITFTAHTASTYFTIAIAVDRYVAVCWPSTARAYCTRKRARLTSLLVLLWSFVFNVTRWLEFETVEVDGDSMEVLEDGGNSSSVSAEHYKMQITELRQDPTYKEVYIFWIYLIVMFVVPFVTLSVLNLSIFLGIRSMVKNSAVLTSTQKRDTSFSLMLIGVVLVFLVCNVDYLVLDILEYVEVEFHEFWNNLGNFLLTLNSAVNFLIYCVCGWKFRQELGKIIRTIFPCLQQHGSHDIVGTDECEWVKSTMNMDLKAIPRVSLSKATSKPVM